MFAKMSGIFAFLHRFLASKCNISLTFIPWSLCIVGCFASIVLFYPGEYGYDAWTQYAQSETGLYGDWHPPVMTACWKMLRTVCFHITGVEVPGDGLIYVFHTLLVWGGVLSVLLAGRSFWQNHPEKPKIWGTVFVVVILLIWVLVFDLLYRSRDISKDLGMMGAWLLAVGTMMQWPRSDLKRGVAFIFVLTCLFYGTALRHNGIFALFPLLLWFSWLLIPKKKLVPIFTLGILFWVFLLGLVHYFNYGLLKSVHLYPFQERFYADILMLNARTGHYVAPPNTFGNRFDEVDPDVFLEKFQQDVIFIQNAFKYVNETLPEDIEFTQNIVLIYPHEEYAALKEKSVDYPCFRGDETYRFRILDEDVIKNSFPQDYEVLKKAWIERVLMSPVDYLKMKMMIFIKYCQKTSIAFLGLSVASILMVMTLLTVCFTFSRSRLHEAVFPFLMLGWSALLYILPLLLVLPDDREIRYVYWFITASLVSLSMFCRSSGWIQSLIALTVRRFSR